MKGQQIIQVICIGQVTGREFWEMRLEWKVEALIVQGPVKYFRFFFIDRGSIKNVFGGREAWFELCFRKIHLSDV